MQINFSKVCSPFCSTVGRTQDLELLMQIMDSRLQSLTKLNSDFDYQGTTEESSTTRNSHLFTLERSGNAERSIYEIRQEQIHGLKRVIGPGFAG